MTIQQIAEQIAAELDPSHAERMKTLGKSTHPEIQCGMEALDRHHQRVIKLIIRAVAMGREQYENIALAMALAATGLIHPH